MHFEQEIFLTHSLHVCHMSPSVILFASLHCWHMTTPQSHFASEAVSEHRGARGPSSCSPAPSCSRQRVHPSQYASSIFTSSPSVLYPVPI